MNLTPDQEQIMKFQKTKDPNALAELLIRYQPILHSVVNKYKTTGVSVPTLRAKATTQLLKAFKTYDPNEGTSPTTHAYNYLQKVHRTASGSLMSGHVPEYRNLKTSTYRTVKTNLEDRLGREPSSSEMADEMSWSLPEVNRMESELGGEVTASGAAFDFYGNAVLKEPKDKMLSDYLYQELSGQDKLIMEHTFGYGGKKILNNKELAVKLHTNEMSVHRSKQKLADKIRSYR